MSNSFIGDMLSSPDPLNEVVPSSAVASSRRVTRSQASQRFVSLSSSPRKQTFELDVGNEMSPQKILVTVEAEEHTNVSRRLFASPTPKRVIRRKEKATTTTVPLKGLADDESVAGSVAATPRRRGRPPKSATPTAASEKRKKAPGRPATPRVPRKAASQQDNLPSEASTIDPQATPKASLRGKRSAKRENEPIKRSRDTSETRPRKRGRPRRETLVGDEIIVSTDQESVGDLDSEDNFSLAGADDAKPTLDDLAPIASEVTHAYSEAEEDIWMANLSEPPTTFPQHPLRDALQDDAGVSDEPTMMPEADDIDLVSEGGEMLEGTAGLDSGGSTPTPLQDGHSSRAQSLAQDDTREAGEEFTMISIGSLPSMLRASTGMPTAERKDDLGEETSMIISRTLASLREPENVEESMVVENADEAGVLGEALVPDESRISTTETASASAMFAAQSNPRRSWSRSPRRLRDPPLGKQLAMKFLKQDGNDQPSPQTAAFLPSHEMTEASEPETSRADSMLYEDSFSEIPEAILEAATPKVIRRQQVWVDSERDETEEIGIQPSIEEHTRVNHTDPPSESNKLLTPEETPSPDQTEDEDDEVAGLKKGNPSPAVTSTPRTTNTTSDTKAGSSPPEFGRLQPPSSRPAGLEARHSPAELDSPRPKSDDAQPRPLASAGTSLQHLSAASLVPPRETSLRPTLSPIVRAGRALQLVTSDPPSPAERGSVLRSPFRASVAASQSPAAVRQPTERHSVTKSPSSMAQAGGASVTQPERSWADAFAPFNQFKSLMAQSIHAFSPKALSGPAMEDPFGPDPRVGHTATSVPSTSVSPVQHAARLNKGSFTSSVVADYPSDEEMSWQAEQTPSKGREQALSSRSSLVAGSVSSANGKGEDMDLEPERTSSTNNNYYNEDVEAEREDAEEETEEEEEEEQEEEQEEEDEDEEDIWAFEAQRPTATSLYASARQQSVFGAGRRAQLPSPWRQNKEPVQPESREPILGHHVPAEAEEFSLLSRLSRDESQLSQQPAQPKNTRMAAVKSFASFFSSPAAVPDARPPPVETPGYQVSDKEEMVAASSSAQSREELRDTPAKRASFPHQQQPMSESAESRSHPLVGQERSATKLPSIPQKAFEFGSHSRTDLFSPQKNASLEAKARTEQHSPSRAAAPPLSLYPRVPQKNHFTPRQGQFGRSLFSRPTEPTTVQSIEATTEDMILDEDQALSSVAHESSSFQGPELKPLPDRGMSPSKSCMRSPLKPKTPGRVVEFTSSTLSPLAQAQVRAERRAGSFSPEKQPHAPLAAGFGAPSRLQEMGADPRADGDDEADKENTPSRPTTPVQDAGPSAAAFGFATALFPKAAAALASSSSAATAQRRQTLSQTQWSRAHWLRLDELLQQRRANGALQFQLQHPINSSNNSANKNNNKKGGRSSTAALLGKQVASQGEKMRVEPWHLDVVDAFLFEVGGWDETVLVRRLFALLVGEERRRLGKVPRPRRAERV